MAHSQQKKKALPDVEISGSATKKSSKTRMITTANAINLWTNPNRQRNRGYAPNLGVRAPLNANNEYIINRNSKAH